MAEDTTSSTYTLTLRDEISATANKAAGTLEALKKKLSDDSRALGELTKAMRNMRGATGAGADTLRRLRDQSTATKASIARTQGAIADLGGVFGDGSKQGQGFLSTLAGSGGPLSSFARKGLEMKNVLSSAAGAAALGAEAVVGFGVALLAMVGVAAVATAAVLRFGVAHADARRHELLHLEGLTRLRRHMAGGAGSATELQAAIDRVSASSSLGRSEVAGHAEALYRMGLRGHSLSEALEGTAIAAAAAGEEYGRRFRGMAAAAVRTGGSVDALTDRIRKRFGPIASRMATGLTAQFERFQEGLAGLFDGLHIEGFLHGLSEITSLFSRGSATAEAWGTLLEVLFNPVLDGAGGAAAAVRSFVERTTIWILRVTIVVLRLRNGLYHLRDAFPQVAGVVRTAIGVTVFGVLLGLVAVFAALALLSIGLVVAIGLLVAPFVLFAVAVNYALDAMWAFGVGTLAAIRGGVAAASSYLTSVDWTAMGTRLVDGLVGGIRAGAARVADTVRGLASTATTALRDALDIASPSRVFASLGAEIPRGLAAGVDEGAGEAGGAVERMSRSLEESPVGGAVNTRSSSATSIGPFYITVEGGGDRSVGEQLEAELVALFERLAITRGAT